VLGVYSLISKGNKYLIFKMDEIAECLEYDPTKLIVIEGRNLMSPLLTD